MNSPKVFGIAAAVIIIVGGGAILVSHSYKTAAPTNSYAPAAAPTAPASTPAASSAASRGQTVTTTITADDTSADKETLSFKTGDMVSLTFNVKTGGVYHGGLQFISTDPAIDSGPIKPGSSKTVQFTASKSFSFTPYWYASQVKKDYLVQINVQ